MHTAVLQSMALPDEFIALLLVMVIPLQHVASKGTRGLSLTDTYPMFHKWCQHTNHNYDLTERNN